MRNTLNTVWNIHTLAHTHTHAYTFFSPHINFTQKFEDQSEAKHVHAMEDRTLCSCSSECVILIRLEYKSVVIKNRANRLKLGKCDKFQRMPRNSVVHMWTIDCWNNDQTISIGKSFKNITKTTAATIYSTKRFIEFKAHWLYG